MDEFIAYGSSTELPTIHVISDSVGLTAQAVARAAAAQFLHGDVLAGDLADDYVLAASTPHGAQITSAS